MRTANKTEAAIIRARKHLGKGSMESSARLCMAEAVQRMDEGKFEAAHMWAQKSLAYSVGIFHSDYQKGATK